MTTSTVPIYLWHNVFKTDSDLNQIGYKVAAYSSTYIWAPTAFLSFINLFSQNLSLNSILLSSYRFTIAGPWLYNLLACYYLLGWSTSTNKSLEYAFYVYSVLAIIFQATVLPKVMSWGQQAMNFVVPPMGVDSEEPPILLSGEDAYLPYVDSDANPSL